jgi:predicted HicB family RNase H-like nuclease
MAKNRRSSSIPDPKHKPEDYLYSVIWSPNDKAFIGRVLEFPSLAAHGSTQEKALREIRSVVKYALEDLTETRELAPEPLSKRSYSGTLNLRMPKHLHRQLAIEAAQEGVSLNHWINTKLAAFHHNALGTRKASGSRDHFSRLK